MPIASPGTNSGPLLNLRNGITLVVLAPFGADNVLSSFPDGLSRTLAQHPLLGYLQQVAQAGVRVSAMIDLFEQDTYLVDIPAGAPAAMSVVSLGKQDMLSPRPLTYLLVHARRQAPEASLVLAIEGHGAGYLPELDRRLLTLANVTGNGTVEWRVGQGTTRPYDNGGSLLLQKGAPVLPISNPTMPTNDTVLSTWALGAALQWALDAGVPKLAAIHFNNCFNMSVEVLHTVAPYAEVATGYCNYNFFTAGEAYPAVFGRLAAQGSATASDLARWFAEANRDVLATNGWEPTVGCAVALGRLHDIVEKVDDLSDALLAALRTSPPSERAIIIEKIKHAIVEAQKYDSRPDFVLKTPDELTDLDSLAVELARMPFHPYKVQPAAQALHLALEGVKVYGDSGHPWMAPEKFWDFSRKELAMNIFLPDPCRKGLWDWRSQYYLDVNPDPNKPQVQRHIIDFVKITDWVDFLIEYHKDVPFVGLLPAQIPPLPPINRGFKPPREEGDGDCDGDDKGDPRDPKGGDGSARDRDGGEGTAGS